MKNDALYLQCLIQKENKQETIWIEKKFAQQDRAIKVEQDDDTWEEGWRVAKVYAGVELTGQYLRERSQDYKRTRSSSDV